MCSFGLTDSAKKITKIERQERNRSRYSIFLDGEYAFGLDEEIVFDGKIALDQILREEKIAELLLADERKRAKTKAFRFLSIRDHSERELAEKLRRSGFTNDIVRVLVEELRERRYLNDETFAKSFARSKIVRKPIGRRGMTDELKRKGIAESILESTLDSVYSEFDEMDLARRLAEKKIHLLKNDDRMKVKKSLSDFLMRRGFGWEIVEEVLNEVVTDAS